MPLNEEQSQNRKIAVANASPLLVYCALGYLTQDSGTVSPPILLVLKDAKGSLRFLAHPDWRSTVHPVVLRYMDSLLKDIRE